MFEDAFADGNEGPQLVNEWQWESAVEDLGNNPKWQKLQVLARMKKVALETSGPFKLLEMLLHVVPYH